MASCDVCRVREARVYQAHTGRRLCDRCFIDDVKSRIRETVKRFRLLEPGDTVLLAVSGGKDSFVLLDTMPEIHPPSKLVALSIIEGIPGYNKPQDILKMREYARDRGVELIITSIKEHVGEDLHGIVKRSRGRGLAISACTYCGGLRRRLINTYARQLGVTKTATAHNLDDEVQTMLMNILRGDPARIIRQHPRAPRLSDRFVQRIKPLRYVYEWEAAMYSYLRGFKFQETECMFINEQPTFRARIRHWLFHLERYRPGTMLRMLQALDEMSQHLVEEASGLPPLPTCKACGEPTSYGRELCKLCELLQSVGLVYKTSQSEALTVQHGTVQGTSS